MKRKPARFWGARAAVPAAVRGGGVGRIGPRPWRWRRPGTRNLHPRGVRPCAGRSRAADQALRRSRSIRRPWERCRPRMQSRRSAAARGAGHNQAHRPEREGSSARARVLGVPALACDRHRPGDRPPRLGSARARPRPGESALEPSSGPAEESPRGPIPRPASGWPLGRRGAGAARRSANDRRDSGPRPGPRQRPLAKFRGRARLPLCLPAGGALDRKETANGRVPSLAPVVALDRVTIRLADHESADRLSRWNRVRRHTERARATAHDPALPLRRGERGYVAAGSGCEAGPGRTAR